MTNPLTIDGMGGKNRSPLDFYPTPPEATIALMSLLKDFGVLPKKVWEPACGNYAMTIPLSLYTEVVSTDIAYGDDFLKTELPAGVDAIITNPPFSLAEEFIRRALGFTPNVAMLLKSQYWHAARRVDLFYSHRPAYICPLTWRLDVTGGGNPSMSHIWTIWLEGRDRTAYLPLSRPILAK